MRVPFAQMLALSLSFLPYVLPSFRGLAESRAGGWLPAHYCCIPHSLCAGVVELTVDKVRLTLGTAGFDSAWSHFIKIYCGINRNQSDHMRTGSNRHENKLVRRSLCWYMVWVLVSMARPNGDHATIGR